MCTSNGFKFAIEQSATQQYTLDLKIIYRHIKLAFIKQICVYIEQSDVVVEVRSWGHAV